MWQRVELKYGLVAHSQARQCSTLRVRPVSLFICSVLKALVSSSTFCAKAPPRLVKYIPDQSLMSVETVTCAQLSLLLQQPPVRATLHSARACPPPEFLRFPSSCDELATVQGVPPPKAQSYGIGSSHPRPLTGLSPVELNFVGLKLDCVSRQPNHVFTFSQSSTTSAQSALLEVAGQLAVGTCEIVMLNKDNSVPRRTIARQTARCACRRGQIAGTTRARPACVDGKFYWNCNLEEER
ncbi:hypothetical protein WMY93_027964 [Mugilogobius chulae]|uniref:Uncharacterized protein n=1 Tax=Mugilogobius chulae TaxID=88201 RepID=A0AAW0MVI2_9GOBI